MRISILAFGAIASVITINSVLATSSTVTSKDYVDAQDALKQNKIPATGTNASTPGDTVVTYTSTAGTIGERGIFDGTNGYDSSTDADKLVTADVAYRATECVYNSMPNIYCTEYDSNNNCLLMGVGEPSYNCDEPWYGTVRCTVDADCPGYDPNNGCHSEVCNNGICGIGEC